MPQPDTTELTHCPGQLPLPLPDDLDVLDDVCGCSSDEHDDARPVEDVPVSPRWQM
ncbi:hypothetical protein ACFFKU_06965 [Kineococcus gynurae]|uniref:Uncharacterized protein n=1 Tax=Kineococcus gynurae TaxID=452979 RepID=A0ABV5LWW1_9ACTN